MSFTLPDFNMVCDLYDPADGWYPGTASEFNLQCQIYLHSKTPAQSEWILRMPIEPLWTLRPYLRAGNAGFLVWNASHTAGMYFVSYRFFCMHVGFPNSYFAWGCNVTDNLFGITPEYVFDFNS